MNGTARLADSGGTISQDPWSRLGNHQPPGASKLMMRQVLSTTTESCGDEYTNRRISSPGFPRHTAAMNLLVRLRRFIAELLPPPAPQGETAQAISQQGAAVLPGIARANDVRSDETTKMTVGELPRQADAFVELPQRQQAGVGRERRIRHLDLDGARARRNRSGRGEQTAVSSR
jgi:hypothetical protein